ncbi:MAG: ASKHA domain-containing protein [Candidatus Firestonebacteria bacterium]
MKTYKIKFYPDNVVVTACEGENLLELARKSNIEINSVCGGDGVCGKCKVIVKSGEVTSPSTLHLDRSEVQKGYVLACLITINDDLEIEVPLESKLDEGQILLGKEKLYSKVSDFARTESLEKKTGFKLSPLTIKLSLDLPTPSIKDNKSDLERIYREIKKYYDFPIMQTGLSVIKQIGNLLREGNWKATVTLGMRNKTTEVIQIEKGDTSFNNFGISVDVGTTTVVAEIVNLSTGEILGVKGTYNKQISYGSDVISRIIYATEKKGLDDLRNAVVENINTLINSLVSESKIKLHHITGITCAGNTTMTHLLLGIDPGYIRKEPYIPTASFVPVIRASEVGIKINPRGLLATLPCVASYVGGDIAAGVLASGIAESKDLSILIDMGTNGEIVLGNKDWLCCSACSAGPAFEGSGITSGMRARNGAIETTSIDKRFEIEYSVIGNVKPHGICGSGLIDLLGELLKSGVIDRRGKINDNLSTNKVRHNGECKEFVLVWGKDTDMGDDIVITENDITNLIRAKAAIFAGTLIMLRKLNIPIDDVKHYYIAGAFGSHLNIEKAIFFGLLPDLPRNRFEFIGNSSLTGAREFLLSESARDKCESIAKKMTSFELSVEPGYMDEYVCALFLPHTDLELFPTYNSPLTKGE